MAGVVTAVTTLLALASLALPVSEARGASPSPLWSTHLPSTQDGLGAQFIAVLPQPVGGATVAVLTTKRVQEPWIIQSVPTLYLLRGADGAILAEHRQLPNLIPLAMTVTDLDGDGAMEELVITDEQGVLAIDLTDGRILWQWPSGEWEWGRYLLTGPVAITPGPQGQVLALTRSGIHALRATDGRAEWDFDRGPRWGQFSGPVVAPHPEGLGVVGGVAKRAEGARVLEPPTLDMVDIATHLPLWNVTLNHDPQTVPVFSLNGPGGQPSILFLDNLYLSGRQRVFAVSPADGRLQWETEWRGVAGVDRSPTLVDSSIGPMLYAVPYERNRMMRFEAQTGNREVIPAGCPGGDSGMRPVDLTGDGFHEIVTASPDGWVCILRGGDLAPMWMERIRDSYTATTSLGDIDDEPGMEFLVLARDGSVDAFDLPASFHIAMSFPFVGLALCVAAAGGGGGAAGRGAGWTGLWGRGRSARFRKPPAALLRA